MAQRDRVSDIRSAYKFKVFSVRKKMKMKKEKKEKIVRICIVYFNFSSFAREERFSLHYHCVSDTSER